MAKWEKIVYAAIIATVIFLSGVAYTIECAKLEYHEDQQIMTLEIFGEVHCYK